MRLSVKEFIKLLLLKENMTQKELVEKLCAVTNTKHTTGGLSRKLNRGTMSYNEAMLIADILGYEIKIEKKSSD